MSLSIGFILFIIITVVQPLGYGLDETRSTS